MEKKLAFEDKVMMAVIAIGGILIFGFVSAMIIEVYSRNKWREVTSSYYLEKIKEEAVEQYKLENNIVE
jgi:hypothetical protein